MKNLSTLILGMACFLFVSNSAMAVGIGVYGDFNRGLNQLGKEMGGKFSDRFDFLGATGGLVIDSAVATENLFNYRLRIGAGINSFNKKKVNDISMVHTFGFSPAGAHGQNVRFWLGPRIGLHYYFAPFDMKSYNRDLILMTRVPGYALIKSPFTQLVGVENMSLGCFRGDIGMVLAGFNFNIGDYATLSIELGFDYGLIIGNVNQFFLLHGPLYGEGFEGFATMAFMLRINDTYKVKDGSGGE